MATPQICTTLAQLDANLAEFRAADKRIALVPTMGALHHGHLSLVKLARVNADRVVVSIFVNPSQFNDPKDLAAYPKTLEADVALLESVGTALVFAPSADELYPAGFQSWITVDELSSRFEGAARPGHFRGVATVVTLLFNLVRPQLAVFGEKDFQQLRVIERLTADLKLGVHVMRAPTVRDESGLAMSSRNRRLSPKGLQAAAAISRALRVARDARRGGEERAAVLKEMALDLLRSEPLLSIDYLEIADELTLSPLNLVDTPARMLAAATVEGVHLIDNIEL